MSSAGRYTVLLIEPEASLQRLIVLGLQQRGLRVVAANSLDALAEQAIADPDLLVLDIDQGWRADAHLLTTVQTHPYLGRLPMVVLAWEQSSPDSSTNTLLLREYLAKPFDARRLHATIEHLLETSAALVPPGRADPLPTPAASQISTTSLCPLLTAAGLLLMVFGLMLQPIVAGLGLLVVLIGLLWWTLGKGPERQILLAGSPPNSGPAALPST